ncbi:hypothetical protein AGMMS50222_10870 [Endomicrobiia bacterium]|nr:hypothetical protein AGMMS50222_10870 [Endomicrobiia bacterium]
MVLVEWGWLSCCGDTLDEDDDDELDELLDEEKEDDRGGGGAEAGSGADRGDVSSLLVGSGADADEALDVLSVDEDDDDELDELLDEEEEDDGAGVSGEPSLLLVGSGADSDEALDVLSVDEDDDDELDELLDEEEEDAGGGGGATLVSLPPSLYFLPVTSNPCSCFRLLRLRINIYCPLFITYLEHTVMLVSESFRGQGAVGLLLPLSQLRPPPFAIKIGLPGSKFGDKSNL